MYLVKGEWFHKLLTKSRTWGAGLTLADILPTSTDTVVVSHDLMASAASFFVTLRKSWSPKEMTRSPNLTGGKVNHGKCRALLFENSQDLKDIKMVPASLWRLPIHSIVIPSNKPLEDQPKVTTFTFSRESHSIYHMTTTSLPQSIRCWGTIGHTGDDDRGVLVIEFRPPASLEREPPGHRRGHSVQRYLQHILHRNLSGKK
jgi:hypothetical protein